MLASSSQEDERLAIDFSKEDIMADIMTTREVAKYLKLHEITICKYAAEGKIPAIRIGRVWRFDKATIDKWIGGAAKQVMDTGIFAL
jgi:excisionase family DNA binding protein